MSDIATLFWLTQPRARGIRLTLVPRLQLSLALPETPDALPTELRLLHFGLNATAKGDVLLDEQGAADIMRAYQRDGVDLMIDLEHFSIDPTARIMRPDAVDARGWCGLELRSDGIYVSSMRWTPDGAQRLTERRQRYLSPVIECDDSGRAVSIYNVALVAMPATHDAAPLMAAGKEEMTPEDIKRALDALIAGDAKGALEILKAIVTSAATGGETAEDAPAPEGDAMVDAGCGAPPEGEDENKKQLSALSKLLGDGDVLANVKALSSRVAELESREAKAELADRQALVTQLIALGAEVPAFAWRDADKKLPADRLMREPIEGLRDRVTALSKLPRSPLPIPPNEDETLTDAERKQLSKLPEAAQAKFKAIRAERARKAAR